MFFVHSLDKSLPVSSHPSLGPSYQAKRRKVLESLEPPMSVKAETVWQMLMLTV